MKKTLKAIMALALIAVLAVSFAGCAKINYVTNGAIKAMNEVKSGDWKNAGEEAGEDAAAAEDKSVLDAPFTAGTYGGVEFADLDAVANYYKEAYENTKAETAQYVNEDGSTATFYALLGEDDLTVESILIDGSENATINNLVPSIMGGLFSKQVNGLPPAKNRDPELDKDDEGQDFRTCYLVGEDLLDANVVDNGDGTITMTLQPKQTEMSTPGKDAQGHVFSTLGDIGSTVASISVVSFAQGDYKENINVTYKGGTAVVKIDTASKKIVEAEYTEMAYVAVQHVNITVIKDKNANMTIKYWQKFPCSDDYMKETKGITRA